MEDKVYGVMVAFTQISNEGFRVKATCETFRVLVRSSRVIGEEYVRMKLILSSSGTPRGLRDARHILTKAADDE